MDNTSKPILYYHYTSLQSFYNIITNKSIWFTNLKNSNDPQEGNLSICDYLNYLRTIFAEINPNSNVKNESTIDFIKDLIIEQRKDVFGISMTKQEDSLLNWTLYGDNHKGVALVFNLNALYEWINSMYINRYQVLYFEEDRINFIKTLYASACKALEVKDNVILNNIFASYYPICVDTFKSNMFSQESEYRLIFNHLLFDNYKKICDKKDDNGSFKFNIIVKFKKNINY